jgi:hypothetical protein
MRPKKQLTKISKQERERRVRQRRASVARPGVVLAKPTASAAAQHHERPLADDLLRGAQKIADYLGIGIRECFYQLERGHIPATKAGGWITTRSRLERFYNGDTVAPAKQLGASGGTDAKS